MKTIKNYSNYIVTPNGKVWSLKRKRYLKPGVRKDGRLYVTLYNKETSHNFKIHRLVAEVYLPNPENKPEVNHIDGDHTNNEVSNLEWVYREENIKHAVKNGLAKSIIGHGEKNPFCKYSDELVEKVRKDRKLGLTYGQLMKKYEIPKGWTAAVCTGRTRVTGTKTEKIVQNKELR